MLSQSEYLNNPRMSQSKLKKILEGYDEFKKACDEEIEQTDAMRLGTAVHTLLLEPHNSNLVVCVPKINSATREGKIFNLLLEGKPNSFFPLRNGKTKTKIDLEIGYEVTTEEMIFICKMREMHHNLINRKKETLLLSEKLYAYAYKMVESIKNNTDAMELISSCHEFEKPYFWSYKGIDFKCKVDGEGKDFLLDLKTTSIKNLDYTISREIENRGYDFQAAAYLPPSHKHKYFIIFVRNEPPFTVFPIRMSPQRIGEGADKLNKACDLYNQCLKENPTFKQDNRIKEI